MSEEQKETILENTNNSSEKPSPEEERKKQFERVKEKFKKQDSTFGGNKNSKNNGNNFYWIYVAVIGVLLFIVFYGYNFNSHLIEVSQGEFYQKMLSKGDVKDIVIVNKTIARISINPDSAYKCDRYKNDKGVSIFPDKNFKGPHYFFTVPSIDNLMTGIEKVQNEALIPKEKQVFARSVEESNWFDICGGLLSFLPLLFIIIIAILLYLIPFKILANEKSGILKIKEAGEELNNKTLIDASSFLLMSNKIKFRLLIFCIISPLVIAIIAIIAIINSSPSHP